MHQDTSLTLFDRFAFMFLGALTGAAYGLLIAIGMLYVTEQEHWRVIGWSTAVFAGMGFISGNFLLEAALMLIHFVWGVLGGASNNDSFSEDASTTRPLRAVMLVGFGTGLVIYLAWHR